MQRSRLPAQVALHTARYTQPAADHQSCPHERTMQSLHLSCPPGNLLVLQLHPTRGQPGQQTPTRMQTYSHDSFFLQLVHLGCKCNDMCCRNTPTPTSTSGFRHPPPHLTQLAHQKAHTIQQRSALTNCLEQIKAIMLHVNSA